MRPAHGNLLVSPSVSQIGLPAEGRWANTRVSTPALMNRPLGSWSVDGKIVARQYTPVTMIDDKGILDLGFF